MNGPVTASTAISALAAIATAYGAFKTAPMLLSIPILLVTGGISKMDNPSSRGKIPQRIAPAIAGIGMTLIPIGFSYLTYRFAKRAYIGHTRG